MYFNLADILKAEHEAIKATLISEQTDDVTVDRIKGIVEFVDGLMNAEKEKEGG